jgi:Transposase DDE domain group 1
MAWLQGHLDYTMRPLLSEPWILDIDTTVKPLYGHQQGAVVSYNPNKRGRPSHSYHSYILANLRLVLAVEVAPGNQHTSKHSSPRLWELLDGLAAELRPWLIRGDVGFGNEPVMREAEQRRQAYLFKLRLAKGVKRAIERAMGEQDWQDAGARWQGKDGRLRLEGWSQRRRIVILRRRTQRSLALAVVPQHLDQSARDGRGTRTDARHAGRASASPAPSAPSHRSPCACPYDRSQARPAHQ